MMRISLGKVRTTREVEWLDRNSSRLKCCGEYTHDIYEMLDRELELEDHTHFP
jgi:hypothetical protein